MNESPWIFYGSVAGKHWFDDFREPKDIDILTKETFKGSSPLIETKWHNAVEKLIGMSKNKVFLDADLLFTNKVSHAHWDIKWDKTIYDIRFFIDHGCTFRKEAYDLLIPIWEKIHAKKKVNLNVPNEEFFTGYVKRAIPHDELHFIVAGNKAPMHTKIKKNPALAKCDEELFLKLSKEDQLKTALEELCVIAIERFELKLSDSNIKKMSAFGKSYKQLITTMTYGWFARFVILSVNDIFRDKNVYMGMINDALKIIEFRK